MSKVGEIVKIGFGGGCHWCTEAVFQALQGVIRVEQGWIASFDKQSSFSEAVIVHFATADICLETLIEVHLVTHKSSSNHSMRQKYRSAVYSFSESQKKQAKEIIQNFQYQFDNKLITEVYAFKSFQPSSEDIQNYYKKNPSKPFCTKYIDPKLRIVADQFEHQINREMITDLNSIEAENNRLNPNSK